MNALFLLVKTIIEIGDQNKNMHDADYFYSAIRAVTMGRTMTMDDFCGSPFWEDGSLYNNSAIPNVSDCFQHTILDWTPAAFFWLLFPAFLWQIIRIKKAKKWDPLPYSILISAKLLIAQFLTVNALFLLVKTIIEGGNKNNKMHAADYFYPAIRAVTMVALGISIGLCRRNGLVSSGILFNTWLLFAICGAPEFYSWLQKGTDSEYLKGINMPRYIAYLTWYPLIVLQTVLFCFADPRHPRSTKSHKKHSPELDSSFLNRLTLWWFNSLAYTGSRKALEVSDLYQLNHGSSSEYLVPQWNELWTRAMQDYRERKAAATNEATPIVRRPSISYGTVPEKQSPEAAKPAEVKPKDLVEPPSVIWRLFLIFKFDFIVSTVVKLTSDVLQFASPWLLSHLITFVSDQSQAKWIGISLALLMFITSELRSFIMNYYFYVMFRVGTKLQTVLTAAVYQKTLRLSPSARKEKTIGEIVNLMSIDIERFQFFTQQIQQFWSSPFQILVALIYLYQTLGPSALTGVAIMALFIPLNIGISMAVRGWNMQQMKLKDQRTKLCNEVLNGAKVVKLYAWEPPMEAAIIKIREQELVLIKKSSIVRSFNDVLNISSPFLVAILAFSTYLWSDKSHVLTPQIAFVSLTLFNQLQSPMRMIAFLMQQTVQVVVSNRRLKEFFAADELDHSAVDRVSHSANEPAVEFRDASYSWQTASPTMPSTLKDINLTVSKGNLLAVVGKVGAGKSSLLSAMLGELSKQRGYLGVRGTVAYVPQQAWIQNMTLKENITFGKHYDKTFYETVVEACALKPDFEMLPQGDMTEIGEKGINLSGGQKARISLARAVYQNLDVYLLDDPLSAVDSHVGKALFKKVIGPGGLLGHKTRILVTHGITFLHDADAIALIQDGRIMETGSFTEMMQNGNEFAKFIEDCKNEGEAQNHGDNSDEEEDEGMEMDDDRSHLDISESTDIDSFRPTFREQLSSISTVSVLARKADQRRRTRGESIVSTTSKMSRRRRHSRVSLTKSGVPLDQQLIKKEHTETGRVKLAVYGQYVRSASFTMCALFIGGYLAYTSLQLLRSLWLSDWANESVKYKDTPEKKMSNGERLGIYGAYGVTEVLSFFVSSIALIFGTMAASRNLHTPMLHNILRSPMEFFDTTPIGRIVQRFSKDMEVVDQMIPMNFRFLIMCIFQVLMTLIVIVISTPIFAAVIIPLMLVYVFTLRFYVPTSRQLKRLESTHRSPIYSHFGESVTGAASIRAYAKTSEFCRVSELRVDAFIRVKYLNLIANRWLAVRLEFLGNGVVLFAALFAALSRDWGNATSAGLVGLSVSYALNVTEVLNFAVRQISELETNIVSVERIKEYTETKSEAEWRIPATAPHPDWPEKGRVQLIGYSTRYRDGLDLVLRKITMDIRPSEKIGVVGRTGAGKSSLALALFRMVEPVEGQIFIDGINVATIGLHDLREHLTVIPQDPVLFSGTLRFNLDPFKKHSDKQLWDVLDLAHLRAFASELEGGLDHQISEGGDNISVGQRQLVCLARALLRKTRVLVLDEATAAVDMATDVLIQETIRSEFKFCTVLTIAHRLNTILDYDRVMVLDRGEIREFASPTSLLANRESLFFAMAVDAHIVQR